MVAALRRDALTQQLDHMLARATSVLRHMSDNDTIPKETMARQQFWSALFQATVRDSFGRLTPNIEKWKRPYESILDYWHANGRPLAPSDNTFDGVVYASFQFWNARSERVTAFAVNRDANEPADRAAIEALQEEWSLRWRVMRETQISKNDRGLEPRSIGNIVVNRVDVHHSNTTIFKLRLGQTRNWNHFLKAVPEAGDPLLEDELSAATVRSYVQQCRQGAQHALDSFDIPEKVIRTIFLRHPSDALGPDQRSLYAQLTQSPPDVPSQAEIIRRFASDARLDREIWRKPHVAATLKYLSAYIYNHYYQSEDEWKLKLEDLKYLIVNNITVCFPALIGCDSERDKKFPLSKQHQYCIPVWNSATSYFFLTTKHELSAYHLRAYKHFAERLFFVCWVVDSKAQLEVDREVQLAQATRIARTAILARNFSHSIGSHVLMSTGFAEALNPLNRLVVRASDSAISSLAYACDAAGQQPPCVESVYRYCRDVERALEPIRKCRQNDELKRFFSFLQGRFDYIAGAIFDWRHLPNAGGFHRDILRPLFTQTAYLEHFVSDLGWSVRDMEIIVQVNERNGEFTSIKYSFDRVDQELRLNPTDKVGFRDDIMIAVPISNSAKHAFYSFFENFLRNSLKYNSPEKNSQRKYTVHMMWKYAEDALIFYMWDNLSADIAWGAVDGMRQTLEESLVDEETLVLKSKGLGIKEMRLSAELLSSGGNDHRGASVLRLCEQSEIEQLGLTVPARLVYSFTSKIPVYLALLGSSYQGSYIASFATTAALMARGVRLLALDGARLAQEAALLEDVLRNRSSLPFRTFILCPTDAHRAHLEARIRETLASRSMARTIPIVVDREGHERLVREGSQPGGAMAFETDQEISRQQSLVIAMCELWLLAWKGMPPRGGRWHLFIALAREAETTDAWEKHLVDLGTETLYPVPGKWTSQLISVTVACKDKSLASMGHEPEIREALDKPEGDYWQAEMAAGLALKRALVIDNHTSKFRYVASLDDFRKATRCHIALHGDQSPEFYQELADAPRDTFDFGIFILELVEAMLFQAVVVDERLDQYIQGNAGSAVELEKSGIFPTGLKVISTAAEGDEAPCVYLSESGRMSRGLGRISKEQCDAVIVHEGLLEVALENSSLDDKKAFKQLSEEDVLVVTTSGRGNRSRFDLHHALFLEASALHASVIASHNKLALFRYVVSSLSMQTQVPGGLERAARPSDN